MISIASVNTHKKKQYDKKKTVRCPSSVSWKGVPTAVSTGTAIHHDDEPSYKSPPRCGGGYGGTVQVGEESERDCVCKRGKRVEAKRWPKGRGRVANCLMARMSGNVLRGSAADLPAQRKHPVSISPLDVERSDDDGGLGPSDAGGPSSREAPSS